MPTHEQLLAEFVAKAPHGCVISDVDGRFLMVNKAFADILEESVDAIVGSNYADFTPKEYRGKDAAQIKDLIANKYYDWFTKKYFFRHKDGFVKVKLCLALIEIDGKEVIWSLVQRTRDAFEVDLARDELPEKQLSRDPLSQVKERPSGSG